MIYGDGLGVPADETASRRWLIRASAAVRQAAEQGQAWAQTDLGAMYERGWMVQRNPTVASVWYRRAAEQGDVGGRYRLALLLDRGEGVDRDRASARSWFERAAGQGHAAAVARLETIDTGS